MGKPKKTKEEIKEKRRLAAREHRERIKNDPVLYQQSKIKEAERYNKRKRDRKLLPVCEMSPKNRKKTQKRNRENFRAYYKRQKAKLETIKEEVIKDPNDPLETPSSPPPFNNSVYSLSSKIYINRVLSENSSAKANLKKEDEQQSSSSNDVPFKKILISNACLIASTPRPSSVQSSSSADTMLSLENNKQVTENIDTSEYFTEKASSLFFVPTSHCQTEKTVKKAKRNLDSPLLRLRRHIFKTNKEMSHMRIKMEKLRKEKEKYRKRAFRLKYKNTLHFTTDKTKPGSYEGN